MITDCPFDLYRKTKDTYAYKWTKLASNKQKCKSKQGSYQLRTRDAFIFTSTVQQGETSRRRHMYIYKATYYHREQGWSRLPLSQHYTKRCMSGYYLFRQASKLLSLCVYYLFYCLWLCVLFAGLLVYFYLFLTCGIASDKNNYKYARGKCFKVC